MMTFSEWLRKRQQCEAITSTASVATFARPVMAHSRRLFPDQISLPAHSRIGKKKRKHAM